MALLESPSPVLLEAVLKVDQVVLRLQNLQNTISGIQLSPVNPKHTRVSRVTATTRALSSKDRSSSKENIGYSSRSREDCRRKSFNYNNADQSLKSKDWKQWSSPATQVHDVISEILVASEFAKQIATLVAEALGPQVKQVEPEPLKKKTPPRDGKRRDIAFPSKAQVQKTMSAKAPPSKAVNKFKLAYNDSSAAKVTPPVRISRSDSRRMFSSLDQKLFSSPSESFRDDNDADDELAGSPSTKVTEIKSLKPWKLTPTKGVLFSNPVYLETTTLSPPPPPAPRIVPTTGRRRSWLTHQFPKKRCSPKRKVVSPPSRYVEMVPLDGPRDNSLVSTLDVLKGGARRQETRASRSQSKANSKQAASVASPDKENAPLPSCAPSATKFLRSMSSGQTLHRSSSRKNPGASLLQRAKGWMSSQVARQGKGREVPERSPEARGFTSTRRYSLPGQLRAIPASSRRLSLPGHLRVNWTKTTQPVHVFKVMYPLKPLLGSSIFPGSMETFLTGPEYGAPSTLNLRRRGKHRWLRRAIKLIVSVLKYQ